jgi:hypothetical protein
MSGHKFINWNSGDDAKFREIKLAQKIQNILLVVDAKLERAEGRTIN